MRKDYTIHLKCASYLCAVPKPETLTFTVTSKGTGSGEMKRAMAFDRKDYGMNKGIPFVKIADRVEVTSTLRASG
jgi:polyisoprenoid-binding protein YceI